jgi:OFA family oxalate/formate antiporter-like MFS transporter
MLAKKLESKRWFVAIAVVIIQLCLGTVHGWSVYKKPLMATHSWSENSIQATYMIMMGVMGIASAFVGMLIEKKGPRFIATLGGILFGCGSIIAGLAINIDSLFLLYIGYGLLGGIGAGFDYVTPISALIKWFPDKRGLVSGLAVMGFGCGAFFVGLTVPQLIIKIGISNTFYILGTIFMIFIVAASSLCNNPPDKWLPANFAPITPGTTLTEYVMESFTFTEAVRKPQWWLLWGILFLNIAAGFGLISQLSPLAQEVIRKNQPAITPANLAVAGGTIMAITMIFNGVGRLIWAWISDITGRKNTFIIMFATQAILYSYLPNVTNVALFTLIACYLLSCFGGGFSIMPAFIADSFGPAHLGKIYGVLLTALSFAGILGPLVFVQIKGALYVAASLLVIGLILACAFKKPVK